MQHVPPSKGWRAREAAGKAKLANGFSPELAENIRLAADREMQDRANAEAFATEQERKRLESLCTCPTCGGNGRASVEDAALALAGTEHYRQRALKPDPRHYEQANATVRPGVTVYRSEPDPAAVARIAQDIAEMDAKVAEAQTESEALAEVIAAESPKKPRRHVVPPHLAED